MADETVGRAIAAENVRLLLDNQIDGVPEPGTLAERVWIALQRAG